MTPGSTRLTPAPVSNEQLHRLVSGVHHDPHSVLGPHPYGGAVTIRALRPWATSVVSVVGAASALTPLGDFWPIKPNR